MKTFFFMAHVANSPCRSIRDAVQATTRTEAFAAVAVRLIENGADVVSLQSVSEGQYYAASSTAPQLGDENGGAIFPGAPVTEVLNPV